MLISSIFLLQLLIAAPELLINWTEDSKQELEFRLDGEDKEVESCLSNGLQVQYRYEASLCKDQQAWFDSCSTELVQTHFLSQDPIGQTYILEIDRHRDGKNPVKKNFQDLDQAIEALREIPSVKLDFLLGRSSQNLAESNSYLSARVFSRCSGEYNKTWASLSYYLTFGLLRVEGFNTGWKHYELN